MRDVLKRKFLPQNYGRSAVQFLSVYRFISFALSILFLQLMPTTFVLSTSTLQTYVIIGVLGIYTIWKVFSPVIWRANTVAAYAVLVLDFIICIFLVLGTNGINSPFLLYSLAPILTAAVLFTELTVIAMATLATLALSLSFIFVSPTATENVLGFGTNLSLLIIYSMFCFVIATLTFRTNINVRRRIEIDAISDERKRLKREIHDGIAQTIAYLNIKTQSLVRAVNDHDIAKALDHASELKSVMQEAYQDIRDGIDNLGIETISTPLIPTLSKYIQDYQSRYGIDVAFEYDGVLTHLNPMAELHLLRIIQEALTNIRRHAKAKNAAIRISTNRREMEICIQDDGCGFAVSEDDQNTFGHHGLDIIRERVDCLEGQLAIQSELNRGTRLDVTLPTDGGTILI